MGPLSVVRQTSIAVEMVGQSWVSKRNYDFDETLVECIDQDMGIIECKNLDIEKKR